jgi:hypothetical protein
MREEKIGVGMPFHLTNEECSHRAGALALLGRGSVLCLRTGTLFQKGSLSLCFGERPLSSS